MLHSTHRANLMLNLIAATRAEAEPVIQAMKLKHKSGSFPLFCSDSTALVVSGIGKCRAAAACAWLAALSDNLESKPGCWINFGIAGHPQATLGSVFTAHKITDHHNNKVWYPPQIHSPLPTSDLTTVDKPLEQYLPGQLHDMEASGFIAIARMFTSAELVQCVKVVSDNTDNPLDKINPETAQKAVSDTIPMITNLAEHLIDLADTIATNKSAILGEFCQQWHFSVSQKVKLERLLQRHDALNRSMQSIPQELTDVKSAKSVLQWLDSQLEDADYST